MTTCNQLREKYLAFDYTGNEEIELYRHFSQCANCRSELAKKGHDNEKLALSLTLSFDIEKTEENNKIFAEAEAIKASEYEKIMRLVKKDVWQNSSPEKQTTGWEQLKTSIKDFLFPGSFLNPTFAAVLLITFGWILFYKSNTKQSVVPMPGYVGTKGSSSISDTVKIKFSLVDRKTKAVVSGERDGHYPDTSLITFAYTLQKKGYFFIFHIDTKNTVQLVMEGNAAAGTHLWEEKEEVQGYSLQGLSKKQTFIAFFSDTPLDTQSIMTLSAITALMEKDEIGFDQISIFVE